MSEQSTERVSHDLSDAQSKIAEAKWVLESAARHEEDAENRRLYRHNAKELGIANDIVSDEIATEESEDC